jgi:deoxyribodipyrimidine photolyase-related protein
MKTTYSPLIKHGFLIAENKFSHFEYQFPDEYRVDEHLKDFCKRLSISCSVVDSEHFLPQGKN